MKILILSAAVMTTLAASAVWAQSPANSAPDHSLIRVQDDDPSGEAPYYVEAPYYMNEEEEQASDDEVDEMTTASDHYGLDISGDGAGSGESGLGEDDYDDSSPGAPMPEE